MHDAQEWSDAMWQNALEMETAKSNWDNDEWQFYVQMAVGADNVICKV